MKKLLLYSIIFSLIAFSLPGCSLASKDPVTVLKANGFIPDPNEQVNNECNNSCANYQNKSVLEIAQVHNNGAVSIILLRYQNIGYNIPAQNSLLKRLLTSMYASERIATPILSAVNDQTKEYSFGGSSKYVWSVLVKTYNVGIVTVVIKVIPFSGGGGSIPRSAMSVMQENGFNPDTQDEGRCLHLCEVFKTNNNVIFFILNNGQFETELIVDATTVYVDQRDELLQVISEVYPSDVVSAVTQSLDNNFTNSGINLGKYKGSSGTYQWTVEISNDADISNVLLVDVLIEPG